MSDPLVADSRLEQVHYLLGVIDARQEQRDSAEAHYRKALELRPDYLLARSALVGLLVDKGRLADARVEIKRVTDADKNYLPGRLMKAAVDMAEKRYEEAELELNALVKERPSDPDVQRELGIYYNSRGRIADAEKALVRGLELQPDSMQQLQELVRFYVQSKQPEKAIQRLLPSPKIKSERLITRRLVPSIPRWERLLRPRPPTLKRLRRIPRVVPTPPLQAFTYRAGALRTVSKSWMN